MALGLPLEARCLELGAGAGGIAAWLGENYSQGTVLVVDIDTSALPTLPSNVTVEQADICSPQFQPGEAAFDLVHCRYVLSHLAEREDVVRRAASWLRPGGWLMLTEPFHLPPETSPNPAVGRVLQAYMELAVAGGADLRWSRRMPFHLAQAGLQEIDFVARAGLMGGGSRDRWQPLLAPVVEALLNQGQVTSADLETVFALLTQDEFLDIPQVIFSAWGRRSMP